MITYNLFSNALVYTQPLMVGFNESTAKPYKWLENETYIGAWIDITKIVAERAGVEIIFRALPLKRLFSYLESGKVDIAFGIYRDADRDEHFIFLNTPIAWSTTYAFVKKGKEFPFNSIKDLYGKEIGILRGLSFGPELNNEIRKKSLLIQNVASYEQNILKLLSNRIDVTFAPGQCFQTLINDKGLSGQIIKINNPITPQRSLHIVFSRVSDFPDKEEVIEKMDLILQEMAENGEIDIITEKYGYKYSPF